LKGKKSFRIWGFGIQGSGLGYRIRERRAPSGPGGPAWDLVGRGRGGGWCLQSEDVRPATGIVRLRKRFMYLWCWWVFISLDVVLTQFWTPPKFSTLPNTAVLRYAPTTVSFVFPSLLMAILRCWKRVAPGCTHLCCPRTRLRHQYRTRRTEVQVRNATGGAPCTHDIIARGVTGVCLMLRAPTRKEGSGVGAICTPTLTLSTALSPRPRLQVGVLRLWPWTRSIHAARLRSRWSDPQVRVEGEHLIH